MSGPIARGTSSNTMRVATCKDCQREIVKLERQLAAAQSEGRGKDVQGLTSELEKKKVSAGRFSYSEHSANGQLDRGGSRSDRCPEHRKKHRTNTQGMAVAYVDLQTIGEALGAHDPSGPTGPLGGLGPLPQKHEKQERSAKLAEYEFGMTDVDIVGILELLRNDRHRVLVLRAGTGTGKSTFAPYRLMDPPNRAELEAMNLMGKVTAELNELGLPPLEGEPFRLNNLGPIVVTEPRVAAATGVSSFVGEKLAMGCKLKQCLNPTHGDLVFNPKAHVEDGLTGPSCDEVGKRRESGELVCARQHVGAHPGYDDAASLPKACVVTDCSQHIGPGFPVGYQAKGVRHWDDSCQLVYATDGAVINWLRDGRLNKIGTVIVDEAHERSTNIDFIMGYLKRDLAKYPHLRVIITSATFEPEFYKEYFGEYHPGLVAIKDVPAVKTVGYGLPLFPDLDLNTDDMRAYLSEAVPDGKAPHKWPEAGRWALVDVPGEVAAQLAPAQLAREEGAVVPDAGQKQVDRILTTHWENRYAPALKENEVVDPAEARGGDREYIEDLWDTTTKLLPLRLDLGRVIADTMDWRSQMPDLLAESVIRLEAGLRAEKIFGDILGFLPSEKMINAAVDQIRAAVGNVADVLPLISKLTEEQVDEALAARRKGDRRKIVISTNLAETSLTVEGVRFVVDSGLITQSQWTPELAAGGVGTTLHSQSGIKQRWGRVGRKAPGWVFPLYTKKQFSELPEDTPPGSARENLEQLMMTARLGGIDDVLTFPWPAAFQPTTVTLDAAAEAAKLTFERERDRADAALRTNGAVTSEGYPTALGKELTRFSDLGSASAMGILFADRLACVPEVATILALLYEEQSHISKRLIGEGALLEDDFTWPDEWRVEAYNRHVGLMSLAEDDAHLALLVCAAWERADEPEVAPWVDSPKRRRWCQQWWVNHEVLLAAAQQRQKVLTTLSPAMKKEATRFIEPALVDRARGVLARTMRATEFRLDGDAYVPVVIPPRLNVDGTVDDTPARFAVETDSVMTARPERVLALRRREGKTGDCFVSNLVSVLDGLADRAERSGSSAADAMALVVDFQRYAPANTIRDVALALLTHWPIGQRVRLRAADLVAGSPALGGANVIGPFERPGSTELEERRKKRLPGASSRAQGDDDVTDDALEADAAGDFQGWKSSRKFKGQPDEEAAAAQDFANADRAVGRADREASGCGTCPPCADGNPQRCVELKRIRAHARDALDEWRNDVQRLSETALAAVTFDFRDEHASAEPRWFEVVEYRDGATAHPVVVLADDWRAEGADKDPAKHDGLRAGQRIDVIVGPEVPDHRDLLRIFHRVDGQGRFLLREAKASLKTQVERGIIAPSLSAGANGLLGALAPGQSFKATVVPGRSEGTFTITTLQMLHQHLRVGAQGGGATHPEDPKNPTGPRKTYYHAVVHDPPNQHGFLTFRLLHQDKLRGLHHLISYNPNHAKGGSSAGAVVAAADHTVWAKDTAHLVSLVPDTGASLDVSECDLEEIRALTKDPANGLSLSKSARDNGNDQGDEDNTSPMAYTTATGDEALDTGAVLAGPGAKIRIRHDLGKPLSSKVAEELSKLGPASDAWQNKVWSFWARSFHVKVDDTGGVLPGEASEPIDVRFDEVEFDEELPSAIADREFEKYVQSRPGERRVDGKVTRVDEYSATLDIGEPFEARLYVGNIAHVRVDRAEDVIRRDDEITAVVSHYDPKYRRIELSTKALIPTPFAEFKAAHEAKSDHEKKQPIIGIIDGIDKGFVWVDLGGGVEGKISFRDLSHDFIEDPSSIISEGDELRARVLGFDEERKKVTLSIKATYPSLWEHLAQHLKPGTLVRGAVVRYAEKRDAPGVGPFGVIVDILPGVGGMVHVKEMPGYIPDVRASFPLGQTVQARVLSVDAQKKNMGLSFYNCAGTARLVPAWSSPELSWSAPPPPPREESDRAGSIRDQLEEFGLLRPAAESSARVPVQVGLLLDERDRQRTDGADAAAPRDTRIRLARIGEHTAVVVDVDEVGLGFYEFRPHDSSDRWRGQLELLEPGGLRLSVGDFSLGVVPGGEWWLWGGESGPYGEHDFDVCVLADPSALTDPYSRVWLAIYPDGGAAYVAWQNGVLPDGAVLAEARGTRGGEGWAARVDYWPSGHDDTTLGLTFDEGGRADEWQFWHSDTFEWDRHLGAFVSQRMALFPLSSDIEGLLAAVAHKSFTAGPQEKLAASPREPRASTNRGEADGLEPSPLPWRTNFSSGAPDSSVSTGSRTEPKRQRRGLLPWRRRTSD